MNHKTNTPAAVVADLDKLTSFPLEDMGLTDAPDSKVIFGANDWKLTVGDVRAALARSAAPAPTAEPAELVGIDEQITGGAGFWHECSGCHETEDGHPVGNYAYSDAMRCYLGNGCRECGGIGAVWDNTDYEALGRDWVEEENAKFLAPAVEPSAENVASIDTQEFRELMQNLGYWTDDEDDDCSRDLVAYIDKHTGEAIAASRRTAGDARITCPACKGAHSGMGADGVEWDCSKCEDGMIAAPVSAGQAENDSSHVMPPFAAPAGQRYANPILLAELKRWAGDDPGYAAMLIRAAVTEIEHLSEVLPSGFREGRNTQPESNVNLSAGQAETAAFPERDQSKPAEQQGLFRKFDVRRVDGSDQPGGKHYGCRYYVLDLNHDQHAPAAMRAYATACRTTHPQLAADIEAEFGTESAGQAGKVAMPEPTDECPHEFRKWDLKREDYDPATRKPRAAPVSPPDGAMPEQEVSEALGLNRVMPWWFLLNSIKEAVIARDASLAAQPAEGSAQVASDPMDWPLPCDVTVGAGTIKKGCKLRTLVARMSVLHGMAMETWRQPNVADMVNRFLAWPMPESLSARLAPNTQRPIGTHLMNADEARAMIEHVMAAPERSDTPAPPKLMRQAVANVVRESNGDLGVVWMRPERVQVGTLLYCATEPRIDGDKPGAQEGGA